jgi:hypothetical protein
MVLDIVLDLLGVFLHPLFYLFILFAFWVSYRRVLRERSDFHVRFHSVVEGMTDTVLPGLLTGLLGSVVLIGLGAVVPFGMIVLIGLFYFIFMLTFQLRFVTPAFAVGLAGITAYFIEPVDSKFEWLNDWVRDMTEMPLEVIVLLLGVLLTVEALFIRISGKKKTSPRLLKSKRGKWIGAHEGRRLWLVPLFLLMPVSGSIPRIDWWPLSYSGESEFSLWLVPFGIGFYTLVTDKMPEKAALRMANNVLFLGIAVVAGAMLGWYSEIDLLSVGVLFAVVIVRTVMIVVERIRAHNSVPYFKQRNNGLMILGILPHSPAEKMGLRVGEVVQRVNGKPMKEVSDFYKALQTNAAYCKLDVLDESGEIRFVQGAVYSGHHHELGLLFTDSSVKKVTSASNI